MLTPDFGNWLAGFIDGEGCFIIQHINGTPGNYMARFILNLRDDDREILEHIVAATSLGIITQTGRKAKPHHGGQAQWQVQAKSEVLGLVALLDRFPLRAKKARDYALWREAALLWATTRPRKDNAAVWERMADLKATLANTRIYVPAGTNGTPVITENGKP